MTDPEREESPSLQGGEDVKETQSPSTTASNEGWVALVTLPARVDLPESGILAGIQQKRQFADVNLLGVLYDASPDEVVKAVLQDRDDTPAALGFVSVGDRYRSTAIEGAPVAGSPGAPSAEETSLNPVTPIEDPTNLTGLGVAITRYLDDWGGNDGRPIVLFDSVTSLLHEVETREAFQFLHILRHQITRTGGIGFFIVHPDLHEPETMSILRTLFDESVEYVGTEGDLPALDADDPLMEALASGTRRAVVKLLTEEESLSLSELATRLAQADASEQRGDLEVALHLDHLPFLNDRGVVTYEPETGTVELAVAIERVRPYLRLAREYQTR